MQHPLVTCVLPVGQGQRPAHPSSSPARPPSLGQVGVQTQEPWMQRPAEPQLFPQLQVSMQVPLLQMLPAAHFTPAQRFATQVPPLQSWLAAQWTPAHGLGDAQPRLQALPGPQAASQPSIITQAPVPGLQYCPEGQVTPLHGSTKQPATQAPETQV